MTSHRLLALFPLTLSLSLSADEPKDAAPLTSWSAPLYWQPSRTERSSLTKISAAPSTPAAPETAVFVAMTPCRVIDTRSGFGFPAPFGAPSLVAGATRSFPMLLSTLCSIPEAAVAYSLNVTVTPVGGGLGFLTLWPDGSVRPNASTLNNPNALPALANAAIVPAGNDLSFSIDAYASNATDLIVDINGYYASPTMLGTSSTAIGYNALGFNTGTSNTAIGEDAMYANTSGMVNVAVGNGALATSTAGNYNVALGGLALNTNQTGSNNTAIGYFSLHSTTTGHDNVAIGSGAGASLTTTDSANIDLGNAGHPGDNQVIRIGTAQNFFFAAGIYGAVAGSGVPVYINSGGQLGTVTSSARFKEDIHDMADASSGLLQLRPVTFRYKQAYEDGSKPLDYGLIAEEVAKVYPDLVVKDSDGNVQTVQYQKLTPMLLNEVQKQHDELQKQYEYAQEQDAAIQGLQARLAALEALLAGRTDR